MFLMWLIKNQPDPLPKKIALFTLLLPVFLSWTCTGTHAPEVTSTGDTIVLRSSYIRDSVVTIDTLDIVFYIPVGAHAALTSKRPLKTEKDVIFCCAAAFTLLENNKIDGLFIENGKTVVRTVNHHLGGGIIIPSPTSTGKTRIFGTEMGATLDSALIDSIQRTSSSFFQQIQMLRDGQPLVFRKDVSRFQRRAICILNGEAVVVETKWPCTLQKFADVLKKSGINDALYVDMGSWDEGWYRDERSAMHTIGMMKNSTGRQSNWFVFRGQ